MKGGERESMNRNDALNKAAECLDRASANAKDQPATADVYVRVAGTWLALAHGYAPSPPPAGRE